MSDTQELGRSIKQKADAEAAAAEAETPTDPTDPETPETPTPDDEEEEAAAAETEPDAAPDDSEQQPDEGTQALGAALARESKLHAKRLGLILGDAATETILCPLCGDGLQGFLHPGSIYELTDENREAALAFLGAPVPGHLQKAEGVVECDRCNGYGQLEYPTKVEHVTTQSCPKCGGNGYVLESQTAATQVEHAIQQAVTPQAPLNGANACPSCGQAGMAGQPHYCQPVTV
jgi:hypothetical protein